MRKKKNLDSLKTLAEGKATRWQKHVSTQVRSLEAEQKRLEQLHEYLGEYTQPVIPRQGGQSILAIRSKQNFVDRIKTAVTQQQKTVADQQQVTDRGIERWKQARSKHLALEKFADRALEEEARRRGRRDQARLDEVGRNGFLSKVKP